MAGKAASNDEFVDEVLVSLEKVFSGEVEYDEALMELNLHTAQVRRKYPNLYKALALANTVQGTVLEASPSNEIAELKKMLSELAARPAVQIPASHEVSVASQLARAVPNNAQPVPNEGQAEEQLTLYNYNQWAQQHAGTSRVGDEWLLNWDMPETVPMPAYGAPLTVPTANGRFRFSVIGVDPDLRRLKVKMLVVLSNQ